MTTEPPEASPARKPPRVPVPFRVAPSGKAAIQQAAATAGYEHYTEWIRDVCAAEIRSPLHNPTPAPKPDKKGKKR